MVLAERIELDVPDNHHLIRRRGVNRTVDDFIYGFAIPLRQEPEGARRTLGGLHKSLPLWIIPHRPDELFDQLLHETFLANGESVLPSEV